MSKSDRKFVNFSESHELKGWLNRNNFSGDKENREKLKEIGKKIKGKETAKNLSWAELNSSKQSKGTSFKALKPKATR